MKQDTTSIESLTLNLYNSLLNLDLPAEALRPKGLEGGGLMGAGREYL